MAVPKRKTTPSKRNMRRSHDAIALPQSQECPNCGRQKMAHRVCPHCGSYKGRQVLDVAKKVVAQDNDHDHDHDHDHSNCTHDHHNHGNDEQRA